MIRATTSPTAPQRFRMSELWRRRSTAHRPATGVSRQSCLAFSCSEPLAAPGHRQLGAARRLRHAVVLAPELHRPSDLHVLETAVLKVLRFVVMAGPDGAAAGDIQKHVDLPASTLSHHLKRLVDAGVMKPHVSLNVTNIDASVAFYEKAFGVTATKRRPGYAKFDLAAPSRP